jgi:MFS superfamily sulfate permease-like transporter
LTVSGWFPIPDFRTQLRTTTILCAVYILESNAIAKSVARKNKYEIVMQQEILALGLANVIGSMFSAFPVTGSFSRTSLVAQIGARRQLHGTVTGLFIRPPSSA